MGSAATAESKREGSKLSHAAHFFKVSKQLQALKLLKAFQEGNWDFSLFSDEAPWGDAQAAIAAIVKLAVPLGKELHRLSSVVADCSQREALVNHAALQPFSEAVQGLTGCVTEKLTALWTASDVQGDVVEEINSKVVEVVLAAGKLGGHAANALTRELAESALQAMELVSLLASLYVL
jgi:hypothetical protein